MPEDLNRDQAAETIDSLYEKLNYDDGEKPRRQRKKRRRRDRSMIAVYIIIGILAVLMGAGIAIGLIMKTGAGSRLLVQKAAAELALDMEESGDRTIKLSEMEDVYNMVRYGDCDLNYSLDVSGIENLPVTIGVDGETVRFFDAQRMKSDDTLSVMNSKIADLNITASGNDLYVCVPSLSDSYYMADMENFAQKVNDSQIAGMLGISVPSADYRPFGDGVNGSFDLVSDESFTKKYSDEIKQIAENMHVERLADEAEVELSDGETVECRIYQVTISAEDAEKLVQAVAGNLEIGRDIDFEIKIDDDGHIRAVDSARDIYLNDTKVGICSEFTGAETETDMMTVSVNMTSADAKDDDSEEEKITFSRSMDEEGAVILNVYASGKFEAGLSFEGKPDYDDAAKIMNADIDKMAISYNGEDVVRISGSIEAAPAEGSASDIEEPEGAVDIFDMDLMDLLGLASDFSDDYDQLENLYSVFGGLF